MTGADAATIAFLLTTLAAHAISFTPHRVLLRSALVVQGLTAIGMLATTVTEYY